MAKVDRTAAGAPPAKLGRRTAALKGHLDALPGAAPRPLSAARGSSPIALLLTRKQKADLAARS